MNEAVVKLSIKLLASDVIVPAIERSLSADELEEEAESRKKKVVYFSTKAGVKSYPGAYADVVVATVHVQCGVADGTGDDASAEVVSTPRRWIFRRHHSSSHATTDDSLTRPNRQAY
jgi:hypothetical protein